MICHICGEQAIGQCRECSRFYCRLHGNITCFACGEAVQETPSPPAAPDIDLRLPQFGGPPTHDQSPRQRTWSPHDEPPPQQPVYVGTVCAWCREPAAGACAKCGQFYCANHRGGTSMFDNTRRGWFDSGRVLCTDCLQSTETSGMIGCAIGAVIMIIGAIIMLAMIAR
jgi:hypothetical protein